MAGGVSGEADSLGTEKCARTSRPELSGVLLIEANSEFLTSRAKGMRKASSSAVW